MLLIKEENLSNLNLNSALKPDQLWPSYLISKEQTTPLRYLVINTERKSSWGLVVNIKAQVTWSRSFTLSESAGTYFDEIYLVNSSIKSSFSYKSFNNYVRLPSDILGRVFSLPLECGKPPRFYLQENNRAYKYLKKFPYTPSAEKINSINNQIINIHRGNLGAYFSNEVFCVANFYKNNWFSKKKKNFYVPNTAVYEKKLGS
jgi:hypothetical protein